MAESVAERIHDDHRIGPICDHRGVYHRFAYHRFFDRQVVGHPSSYRFGHRFACHPSFCHQVGGHRFAGHQAFDHRVGGRQVFGRTIAVRNLHDHAVSLQVMEQAKGQYLNVMGGRSVCLEALEDVT